MPFIRGRYHINPVMGQALEAARQAEAALAALEQRARQNSASDQSGDHSGDDSGADSYGDDATGFRSAQAAPPRAPFIASKSRLPRSFPITPGRGSAGSSLASITRRLFLTSRPARPAMRMATRTIGAIRVHRPRLRRRPKSTYSPTTATSSISYATPSPATPTDSYIRSSDLRSLPRFYRCVSEGGFETRPYKSGFVAAAFRRASFPRTNQIPSPLKR